MERTQIPQSSPRRRRGLSDLLCCRLTLFDTTDDRPSSALDFEVLWERIYTSRARRNSNSGSVQRTEPPHGHRSIFDQKKSSKSPQTGSEGASVRQSHLGKTFFYHRGRDTSGASFKEAAEYPLHGEAIDRLQRSGTKHSRAGQLSHPPSSSAEPATPPDSYTYPDSGRSGTTRTYVPSLTGIAATRAAAATQNGMAEPSQLLTGDFLRIKDYSVGDDSESGIGIEVRDRRERTPEKESSVSKFDPITIIPEEIFAHIMSFLDPQSLTKAALVSHRWHHTACSSPPWREVFIREYSQTMAKQRNLCLAPPIGGFGLGKWRPNQEWKQMWKVRKALDARWHDGYAAAIYLEGHKDNVYCVQFDEQKIVTGSRDRTIRIWSMHTFECIKILGTPKPMPSNQSTMPLSSKLCRGHRPFVSITPPGPASEPQIITAEPDLTHKGSILCLQFDKSTMITGSSDSTIIIWDIKAGYLPFRRLIHHQAGVLDVCFDSKHIVSCSKDTTICIWDRDTGDRLHILSGHRGPVNAIQLRGELSVSVSSDGTAKLWNVKSGLCIKEFGSRDRGLACVEFSPDSRFIFAGGNDQVIYKFDTVSGDMVREFKGHGNLVRSLHLDSLNRRIISGSYDNSVKVFDSHTGEMMCDFSGWTTSWMLSAKADYRRIITTSQDRRVVLVDFGYQLPGIELLVG